MVRNPFFKPQVRQDAILGLAISLAFAPPAWSLPQGPVVVNGQVAVSQSGAGTMQVQASNGAIINWQQFSIGAGETTRFVQPSASAAVLNRVIGQDASRIFGQLQANGRVFLINPNGIVIGASGRIDTNGFVASTLDMADADFLAGKLKFFSTGTAGSIVNQGLVTVGQGGRIAFIAPNIENSGVIQAPGGQILLAAGRKIEISSLDFEGVSFEVQAPTDAVLNLGKLLADNGAVNVFAGSLRHSGEIRANRLAQDADGSIRLVGSNEVTLTADSVTQADGSAGGTIIIQSNAGVTNVAGKVSASGADGEGGAIHVLGERVAVQSTARIDASGRTGGGQILVGGDYQGNNSAVQNASRAFVGEGARLQADATETGDGGRIIVWANENTRYFGSISARGGALGGNGGFAEVSGKRNLEFAGSADLTAPRGDNGFLLLDPLDIIVAANGGQLPVVVDQFADFQSNVVTISPAGLNSVGGNVILDADRHIYFNTATAFTGSSLTARAGNATPGGSIYLNQALSTSGGSVDLRGTTVSGGGGITTAGGSVNIQVTGGLSYSAPIVTSGGAVSLATAGGSIAYANVDAGGGTISLSTPAGSIFSNALSGGIVNLNSSAYQSNTVSATNRINATSTSSYVQLYNASGQALRLGSIDGNSGVYLYSNAGMQQAAGGSITAPYVYLSGQGAAQGLGSAAAPLVVASPRLQLRNLAAPAYVAFSGSPVLNELYLEGTLAGLAGTSLTGAGNLGTFSLGNGGSVLNATVVAASGFANGLTLRVTDAGINAPTINLPGALTIDVAGTATLGSVSSQSLNVTADNAIAVASATTSNGSISLSAGNCYYYDSTCANLSPITATTLTAGGSGNIYLSSSDTGGIAVGTLAAGGSINLSAGNFGYWSSSPRNADIDIGSATAAYGIDVRNYGSGAIRFSGALNAGYNIGLYAYHGGLDLQSVTSGSSGIVGTAVGNINFQSIAAQGSSGSVSLTTSGGAIRSTADNTAADIVATTNVVLSANHASNGGLGNLAFANPLDIKAGATSTVTLSSGTSVGALGKAVTVDTNGTIVVAAGAGQFHIAARDALGNALAVGGIDLSASAAGMGAAGTSTFNSSNLTLNAVSDGSTISIGDIVQSAGALNKFRFAASGASGLSFGDVDLTTAGFNEFLLVAGGAMTQSAPGTNNINAGNIGLAAGSGAVTVGNVTAASAVGNAITITGGDITTGDLAAPAISISGANLALGAVASSGTHRGYYTGYDYVPRLGNYQYVTDQLSLSASGNLSTTGNITSPTSALVSAGGNLTVAGGNGTITAGNSTACCYYTDTARAIAGASGTLAAGAISGHAVEVEGGTVNTGALTAVGALDLAGTNLNTGALSGSNVTLSGSVFNTGNVTATGNLQITASGIYQPGAIALSGASTAINAAGGIDLLTNGATLTTSSAYLHATGGGVAANLTGTTFLDLIAGGAFNVASSSALSWLSVQAKGDQLGGASTVSGSGQTFAFSTSGGNTANLNLASASGVQFRYYEQSPAANLGAVNLTANLAAASYLQVDANEAVLNANSVQASGPVSLTTAGDINLNTIDTGGGYLVASSATGDIHVDSVTTLGANVDLTAANGSILKAGAGAVQIDTANGSGANSGEVYLRAANGSVGATGSAIGISRTIGLTVAARDEIAIDLAGTTLTHLRITTGASGSGAIAITNNPNWAGFSLTRVGGSELLLGPVQPGTSGSDFRLTATDGNIRVGGDIAVHSLTLEADGAAADLLISGSGGGRSISAPYSLSFSAGRDVILSAGSVAGDNVTVSGGYTNIFAGRDIKVVADGGSALLAMTNTTSQTLHAGRDIQILGGSQGIAAASAAISSLGSQQLYARQSDATGSLLIQGGTADGASASAQAASSQTVVARDVGVIGGAGTGASATLASDDLNMVNVAGGVNVQGGAGSNAFAVVDSGGYQSIGNQNSYYYDPTDFILVQGGSGAGSYAAIRGGGGQNLQTVGDVNVLGGSAAGSDAEIYAAGGSQSIGSTYGYWTAATQNIRVEAGLGGTARIQAAGSQSILAGGNISVLGGAVAGMTAAIESTTGAQTIGYAYQGYAYNPTDNVIVQGGTGGGAGAWIKAYGGQTVDAGQSISLTAGGGYAEVSTAFGSQTIGNRNGGYDQTDSISLTAGNSAASQARLSSGGAQTLNATGAITVANPGSSAAAIIAGGTQSLNAASLVVSLASSLASAVAEVRTSGNQSIALDGGLGMATLTVTNASNAAGTLAQVRADGDQVVAMPYSTAAGTLKVGDVADQGQSLLYAGGTQNLLVGDVLVQGGATATAAAKILAVGNADISTLNGSVQVLGGAAGSAAIDPPVLNLVTNGSVVVTAGAAATATATITAGNINLGATNGSILVSGGPVAGAAASILANGTPGTMNMFSSGNLTFAPNVGGATATALATAGNNIVLNGVCAGCTGGLVGAFNISAGTLPVAPAADPGLASLFDPTGGIIALMDGLQDLYGVLTLTEEGEITIDLARRRLPQCQ